MSSTVGTVIIDVKADTAKLVSGMDKASRKVKSTVDDIKKTILTLGAAYAGIKGFDAFKGMVNDSLDLADATGKLAQKIGISTEKLSEYQYAAGYAAISNGELNAGLAALTRRLTNFERSGGGAAKQAFKELGISAKYAREHFAKTDDAFKEILKRLEKMPDGYRKTAIAQDIFSKSASSLMRLTASDLKKFGDQAQNIGLTISDSTAKMAAAYHDQMDQLTARITGMKRIISFSLVAPLDAASKTALQMVNAMAGSSAKDKIKTFEKIAINMIGKIVYGAGFIKDAFTGIKLVLVSLEHAFYTVGFAISKFIDTTLTQPMNWLIEKYNKIADVLHLDKIGVELQSRTPDITKKMKALRKEADNLTDSLTDGRNMAKEFMTKFKTNLAEVEKETKKKSTSIKTNIENIHKAIKNTTKDLSADDWQKYFETIGDYQKGWLIEQAKVYNKWAGAGQKVLKTMLASAKKNYFDKFKKESKDVMTKTTTEAVSLWDTATSSMAQSFDDNFFDYIMGKKDAFKNFFKELAKDAVTPFAHNLSSGVTNSLASFFGVTTKATQKFKDLGLSLSNGIWSGSVGGTDVKIDSGGNILQGANAIAHAKSGSDLSSLASTASSLKSSYGLLTNPSGMLLAPSYYMGQGAGLAYGEGFTGTGNFLAGGANVLGGAGVQGLSGAAYAGGLATSGLLGGLGGYAVGSIGDKLLGANTYAGTTGAIGGATGAIIGSIVPGIGTLAGGIAGALLGSVAGGLFGKTSVTGTSTGIDIFGNASSNNANGQDWGRTDYKKKSWFHSSSWSDWKYAAFTDKEKEAVKSVIGSYDYLLSQMGVAKKLTVKGGRFNSIESFLSKNATKSFIANLLGIPQEITKMVDKTSYEYKKSILGFGTALAAVHTKIAKKIENPKLTKIYNAWVDYAKSVNKKVYEAFSSQINQFITDKRNFTEYALRINGNTIGALKYKADYLRKDFEMLEHVLGVSGITVNNYTQAFDAAFRQNLTPQTLKNWENLGNALKASTDASISLRNAQAQQAAQEAAQKAARRQAIIEAREKANLLAFEQAKFVDSLKGTKTALSFAEHHVRGFSGTLPHTIDGLIALRKTFLNSGNTIDEYEQSIIDATLKTRPFLYAINNIAMSLEEATKTMESSITGSVNAIQTLVKYGRDLKTSILTDSKSESGLINKYRTSYNKTIEAIKSGNVNSSKYASDTVNSAQAYLSLLQNTAQSSADIAFAKARISKDLSVTGGGELNTTLSDLKQTSIDYLGADSPIVSWLQTINGTLSDLTYTDYKTQQNINKAKTTINPHHFAEGGIVTAPTIGLIGEAGYNEAIIPLKDSNDPLSMNSVVTELQELRKENREMKNFIIKLVANNEKQLNTQRGIYDTNSQLAEAI